MIDLSAVRVLNGNPHVFGLPVTARFESIGLAPGTMTIKSSGTSGWPMVDIDGQGPSQAATLWVLLSFDGQWYAAGAERLRPGQLNGTKPEAQPQYGGLETLIGDGWFGKHDIPLRNARLRRGQPVGFCLVPGSTRFDTQIPVQGRSDVIVVEWPDANGANPLREVWREGSAAPAPATAPVVTPPAAIPDPSWQAGYLELRRTVDQYTDTLEIYRQRTEAVDEASVSRFRALEAIVSAQGRMIADLQASQQPASAPPPAPPVEQVAVNWLSRWFR